MPKQKQQEKNKKDIIKTLKLSNKKLWDSLSKEKQNAVVDKYYKLTDIENSGLHNVLSNIRQTRISFGSLIIGLILGIIGSVMASILLKYIPKDNWVLDIFIIFIFLGVCTSLFKSTNEFTIEDFGEYKVLEYLLKSTKKAIKNK